MEAEERIITQVYERFPFLDGHIRVQRKRRVLTDPLTRRNFEQVFAYMTEEMDFDTMHLIIGVDDGDDLGFIYVLSNPDKVTMLLKQSVPKSNPTIKSVCDAFPNMLWHERELVDLFGAVIEGLPDGLTYPLPDGWPAGNYPMRKEWKVECFDKETMTYNPPAEKSEEKPAAPAVSATAKPAATPVAPAPAAVEPQPAPANTASEVPAAEQQSAAPAVTKEGGE